MQPIPEKAQFALVGIIFQPSHEEKWTVQDNRKALKSEYPCRTKADVLQVIANILAEMDRSSIEKEPSE
jgi:hypothetical protein